MDLQDTDVFVSVWSTHNVRLHVWLIHTRALQIFRFQSTALNACCSALMGDEDDHTHTRAHLSAHIHTDWACHRKKTNTFPQTDTHRCILLSLLNSFSPSETFYQRQVTLLHFVTSVIAIKHSAVNLLTKRNTMSSDDWLLHKDWCGFGEHWYWDCSNFLKVVIIEKCFHAGLR